jgi:Tfp pilus assembly protein PilN
MINLLPEKYKRELREERKFRLLLVLLFVFTTALVCFALMLGVIKVYIAGSLLLQESKIALLQVRFSQDNPALAEIQAFNEKVSQVSRFLKGSRSVSPILQALAQVLSGGMYLTSFDYDPPTIKNARIQVSGFAKNRETLFVFRENLQKHPLFSELSFPPSNWVQPEDIRFSLQTNVNPSINLELRQ